MYKRTITVLALLAMVAGRTAVFAADLELTDQTGVTIEDQTYDKAVISGCTNVTVRNCNFSSNEGAVVTITGGSNNVTLENCEINGLVDACYGISIPYSANCSDVTVQGCHIHNIADDGVQMHRGTNMKFYDNVIHELYGCGTDGDCGPCNNGHSDGFEIANSTNCEFKRNLIYDVRSTSCFFMDNTGSTETGIVFENNIFYPGESGFCMYLQYCGDIKMHHNVMWRGTVGGLALGLSVAGVDANNNIFSTINTNHLGTTYSAANHRFDYNLIGLANQGMALQEHDTYAVNPLFQNIPAVIGGTISRTVTADDFALQASSPAIDKGTTGADIPTTDFFGNARQGAPDLGAIEYIDTDIDLDFDQIAAVKLYGVAVCENPFSSVVRVAAESRIHTLELYTPDGTPVAAVHVSSSLDTDGVAPGVYMLKAVKTTGTAWVKVMKR